MYWYNKILYHMNPVLCFIKVNSNTIELTVSTSCYCVLDLLCVMKFSRTPKSQISTCILLKFKWFRRIWVYQPKRQNISGSTNRRFSCRFHCCCVFNLLCVMIFSRTPKSQKSSCILLKFKWFRRIWIWDRIKAL